MTTIRLILAGLLLALVGCSKPRDTAAEERSSIEVTLGGASNGVEQVTPPVGPFRLVSRGSYYWHATARDGREYYVESYVSAWTIPLVALGGDQVVYRHRYYHRVLGVWVRTLK